MASNPRIVASKPIPRRRVVILHQMQPYLLDAEGHEMTQGTILVAAGVTPMRLSPT